jgi:GTP-binding protein
LFDTAGLRRRARVVEKLEKLAVADALRAVRFAEVVVLLLDATIPFEKQDLTLADLVEQEGRALVIALNKWDLIDNKSVKAPELRAEADRLLPQLRGTRVIPVSGLTGAHVDKLLEAVIATHEVWNKRISTGRLNRWLEPVVDSTPPPAVAGRRVKIRYMTQPKARPPFFVIFGNQLESVPESYKRFIVNGLRETFDFYGVPIRLSMRSSVNPFAGRAKRTSRRAAVPRSGRGS